MAGLTVEDLVTRECSSDSDRPRFRLDPRVIDRIKGRNAGPRNERPSATDPPEGDNLRERDQTTDASDSATPESLRSVLAKYRHIVDSRPPSQYRSISQLPLTPERRQLDTVIDALSRENYQLRAENARLSQQTGALVALEAEVEKLALKRRSYKEQLADAQRENEDLRRSKTSVEAQLAAAEDENTRLVAAGTEKARIAADNSRLAAENEELRKTEASTVAQMNILEAKIEKAVAKKRSYKEQVSELSRESDELREKNVSLAAQLAAAEAETANLARQNAQLAAENEQLRARLGPEEWQSTPSAPRPGEWQSTPSAPENSTKASPLSRDGAHRDKELLKLFSEFGTGLKKILATHAEGDAAGASGLYGVAGADRRPSDAPDVAQDPVQANSEGNATAAALEAAGRRPDSDSLQNKLVIEVDPEGKLGRLFEQALRVMAFSLLASAKQVPHNLGNVASDDEPLQKQGPDLASSNADHADAPSLVSSASEAETDEQSTAYSEENILRDLETNGHVLVNDILGHMRSADPQAFADVVSAVKAKTAVEDDSRFRSFVGHVVSEQC